MDLPQDPYMKSRHVNMMLQADNMDLETCCTSAGIDIEPGRAGTSSNYSKRQFIF